MLVRIFLKILAKLRLLQYLNVTVPYKRNGRKVMVPIMKSLGMGNLEPSELWMCQVFAKLIPLKMGGFIDIGVNLGQTLIKLKLVNTDIRYLGFDPNPACIHYTQQLILKNGYHNAALVPVGISGQTGLVPLNFYADSDSDSSASIVPDFRPTKVMRQEFVACFKYEHINFPAIWHETVGIIKIDVEGAELEVLKGLRELLAVSRPFIMMEILPAYSMTNLNRWNRQAEIERLLKGLEYKMFRIKATGTQFLNLQPLETIGVTTEKDSADYFMCPDEDVSRLPIQQMM